MLQNDSIARLRALVASSLRDTCTIEKETPGAVDVYGAAANDWLTVAAGVPCRLLPAGRQNTSDAVQAGNRETLQEEYKLVLLPDADIGMDYRITVNGARFMVAGVERNLTVDLMQQVFLIKDNG